MNILLRELKLQDKEKLQRIAKENKRSLNSEILVAIEKYLKEVE